MLCVGRGGCCFYGYTRFLLNGKVGFYRFCFLLSICRCNTQCRIARRDGEIEYVHLRGKLIAQRSRPIYNNTATVTYHHTDHIGSANVETDTYGTQTERTTRMPYDSPYDGFYREGAGYAGHVTDTQTNLTYMQQRYYDPVALRFLSPDPVDVSASDGGNFNRYWYANNNPYKFTDPDGREAKLNWTAPNQVQLVVTYRVDSSAATPVTSTSDIEARFLSDFSGAVEVSGQQVQVTATAIQNPSAATVITVVPTTQDVTHTNREETNTIGGNNVTIGAATGAAVVSHEFGHVAGAGDQYIDGRAANGTVVTTPGPGNNIMQDLRGSANTQTLREVISAPTNTNSCAAGVRAASGGC